MGIEKFCHSVLVDKFSVVRQTEAVKTAFARRRSACIVCKLLTTCQSLVNKLSIHHPYNPNILGHTDLVHGRARAHLSDQIGSVSVDKGYRMRVPTCHIQL